MRVAALVLCVCLSACAATVGSPAESSVVATLDPATPSPSLTPSPTPAPTPSPEPDVASMASAYLAAVEAFNTILCASNARINAAPDDLTVAKDAWLDMANGDRTLADTLRNTAFSTALQPLIDEMIVRVATVESAELNVAGSTTWEEFTANVAAARAANEAARSQSNLIRGELGLASVPVGDC